MVGKATPVQPRGLGGRIRQLRRTREATLREVANDAGVSESFLSQVERGVANPSMATLSRIADALSTNLSSLFVGSESAGGLVRAGTRKRMAHPVGSVEDYLVTPQSAKTMQIIYSVVAEGEGSGSEPYAHGAEEECVIVISGQLEVGVNDDRHLLRTGDALMFDPKSPHSYHNPGPGTTTSLWVTAPPVY